MEMQEPGRNEAIMKRQRARRLFRWLFNTLTRVKAEGLDNLPSTGGYILASNHMSRIDPPLIFIFVERQDFTGLVANKYRNNLFIRPIVKIVDGIYINRESADAGALREARRYLRQGGVLGIAPEGTRSHIGELLPAKTGVAYLADKAGVPVLPIAIIGTDKAVSQLLHLRRPNLGIKFGRPFGLPPIRREHREEDMQRNTDEIMCRIAAMLPRRYHGAYTGHPRLEELLSQGE
jgi:1-acyl-sn-glycerol-3-phosphate acyltransferase